MARSVNIPQANSVETLVYLVEALRDGLRTVDELTREFDVRERTIHYYLELAEWLGFLEDRTAEVLELTEPGLRFGADPDARGGLYHDAIMQHDLVQRALERADDRGFDGLRAAFTEEIFALDVLAEATAKRRAGAMATLVEAAVRKEDVDWRSGRLNQPTRMKRTYKSDVVDEDADTTTFERLRDPRELMGADRFTTLEERITRILDDLDGATSARIRDELAERWEVPLTDPSVFAVLRSGIDSGRWRVDEKGIYSRGG